MDSKANKQLQAAKAYFYSWRLLDAYNVLRRYFDRLPFRPESGHAEYIGMFARILIELGKESELKFYMAELEKHFAQNSTPAIAYPLAVVYCYASVPKLEAAKEIFERIVRDPSAKAFHPKAKMMLADYYLRKEDLLACRLITDSIESSSDPRIDDLVIIWKAVVHRREKKLEAAASILEKLLSHLHVEEDWYAYFSAKVVLALTYLDQGRIAESRDVVQEVKLLFQGRNFRSVQTQLSVMEEQLKEKSGFGTIQLLVGNEKSVMSYGTQSACLKSRTPSEKLMQLLLKKRFIDKSLIVKTLYNRQYMGNSDDKLIYYHVHALRKRLRAVGLSADAITSEENGYRLVPKVEVSEVNGEHEDYA
jgi:tetratricopeptide (TPR) repeat protein